MRFGISVLVLLFLLSYTVQYAHAIIFLPAIVLIPIAKIVAVVIGGMSFSALGLGVIWNKLFWKSLKSTIVVVIILFVLFALLLSIVFKVTSPLWPLF